MAILVQVDAAIPEGITTNMINSTDWQLWSDTNTAIPANLIKDEPASVTFITRFSAIVPNGTVYGRSRLNTTIGVTDWGPLVPCTSGIPAPVISVQE